MWDDSLLDIDWELYASETFNDTKNYSVPATDYFGSYPNDDKPSAFLPNSITKENPEGGNGGDGSDGDGSDGDGASKGNFFDTKEGKMTKLGVEIAAKALDAITEANEKRKAQPKLSELPEERRASIADAAKAKYFGKSSKGKKKKKKNRKYFA